VRPVWVLLDQVFRHDPTAFRSVPDGLELSGRARGYLSHWRRGSRGDWLGQVNYELRYADGREATVWLQDQMLPGYALRPRESD
jgi:hypothetical protein